MSLLSRVDSTSVRTKIAISNVLMFLIPIVVIGAFAAVIISGTSYTSSTDTINDDIDESFSMFYFWELQGSNSKIKSILSESNEYSENDNILKKEINAIEKKNKHNKLMIIVDDKCQYITKRATEKETLEICKTISNREDVLKNPTVTSNEKGLVLIDKTKMKNGSEVTIVLVNDKLDIMNNVVLEAFIDSGSSQGKMAILFILTAIVILILTNLALVVMLSRSILEPINAISEAASEIKTGNLDYEINYHSKNEMGRACKDIDDMRIRLKESVEKQRQYEDNRKAMVMGISHDLATPLTSIKGYALGVIDGIADTPDKVERYVRTIYRSACDMDKLVDELFTYSKLDLGNIPFYFDRVNMIDFFEDMCTVIDPFCEQNDMDFVFDNKCDGTIYCSVDKKQLEKVIRNIAGNSAKYKKPGRGKFTISLSIDDKNNLLVKLADEGQGVEEKVLGKLFDSFFRTDKARSGPSSGSGLGLAIVKSIIEKHKGGKIWAESSLGNGLAILFTLPVIDKDNIETFGKDEKNGEENIDS